MGAIAGSVAVGLNEARLPDEIACDIVDATHMPAAGARATSGRGTALQAQIFLLPIRVWRRLLSQQLARCHDFKPAAVHVCVPVD
jgi:hypothetical protein